MSPTAPLDPFVASLATSHNPSFLGSLGHVVDPTGPSGHVSGLVATGSPQTVHAGPDLAVAPAPSPVQQAVQRIAEAPRLLFGQGVSSVLQRVMPKGGDTAPNTDRPAAPPAPRAEPVAHVQRAVQTAVDERDALPAAASPTAARPTPASGPSAAPRMPTAELPVVSREATPSREVPTTVSPLQRVTEFAHSRADSGGPSELAAPADQDESDDAPESVVDVAGPADVAPLLGRRAEPLVSPTVSSVQRSTLYSQHSIDQSR